MRAPSRVERMLRSLMPMRLSLSCIIKSGMKAHVKRELAIIEEDEVQYLHFDVWWMAEEVEVVEGGEDTYNNSTALLIIFNNINMQMPLPLTLRQSIMRQLSSFVDVHM